MMKYFSGFALENEKKLFSSYLDNNEFSVAGFSYGAIKAFEFAYSSTSRLDKLILISPAFFETKQQRYKTLQLQAYKQNKDLYIKSFLKNITKPNDFDMQKFLSDDNDISQLEKLLTYKWDKQKLRELIDKGTQIEVYLGSADKIIDHQNAYNMFKKYATVYYIKDASHTLI
ncbi:MAG: Unknown protein [uncultured Campylobacterales bacterium]|uniref:Alpha/beta hydrolase n=1 Tax=uncultured Campylobacterales bacterium TaxID=352960 RepID=A0A6S6SXR3_9BACT|nr:MAG: Unknown protein [uncultured Campylobacterales bacterium]